MGRGSPRRPPINGAGAAAEGGVGGFGGGETEVLPKRVVGAEQSAADRKEDE